MGGLYIQAPNQGVQREFLFGVTDFWNQSDGERKQPLKIENDDKGDDNDDEEGEEDTLLCTPGYNARLHHFTGRIRNDNLLCGPPR